jgi:endonuclease III related protein
MSSRPIVLQPGIQERRPRTSVRRPPHRQVAIPQPVLYDYFQSLLAALGPQHWWPGRTRFEVILGAILTQNTSWTNVRRAIAHLRRERLLSLRAIETLSAARLARLIRPSGYYRQKAAKLKSFVAFLRREYAGSLTKMFRAPTSALREQLLRVHGVGPETADSILLYAGAHPVFVVDAYSRRILERHGLSQPGQSYEHLRTLFLQSLPADETLFNEFHALIVRAGKDFCHARDPLCARCPLNIYLPKLGTAPQ